MTTSEIMQVYSKDGVVVGWIEDGVLRKNVVGSKHQLRKPPAWAWDEDIISYAEKVGVGTIEVYDKETGKTYSVAFEKFQQYCINIDRGFGKQAALPLGYWEIQKAEED